MTGKQFSTTTGGKYFIKGFLADRTTQITARRGDATRDIFNAMPEAGFLKVRGHMELSEQSPVHHRAVLGRQGWDVRDSDLTSPTKTSTGDVQAAARAARQHSKSPPGQRWCRPISTTSSSWTRCCRAAAAMNFHHAFIGGLLEHTLNAIEVADAICKFYPGLNRDLVISGIFLTTSPRPGNSPTTRLRLQRRRPACRHIVSRPSGSKKQRKRLVAERILSAKNPAKPHRRHLAIILSHHAPRIRQLTKTPSTPRRSPFT